MAKRKLNHRSVKRRQPISAAAACLHEAHQETDPGRRRFMFSLAYGLHSGPRRADMDKIGDILIEVMGRAYLNFVLR